MTTPPPPPPPPEARFLTAVVLLQRRPFDCPCLPKHVYCRQRRMECDRFDTVHRLDNIIPYGTSTADHVLMIELYIRLDVVWAVVKLMKPKRARSR